MLFAEYYFSVEPDGSIFFDNELTADQMNIKPGDGFMAFVNPNGRVVLRKFDITKVEHIDMSKHLVKEK
jgi:hypothetical protein